MDTDQAVRILFDLMRRDLAQARIGTNQNQFQGTPTRKIKNDIELNIPPPYNP